MQRPPDLKEMLQSGQLRSMIIRDHLKEREALSSIEFSKNYKIQDILDGKGDGKINFSSPVKPAIVRPRRKIQAVTPQVAAKIYGQGQVQIKQQLSLSPSAGRAGRGLTPKAHMGSHLSGSHQMKHYCEEGRTQQLQTQVPENSDAAKDLPSFSLR